MRRGVWYDFQSRAGIAQLVEYKLPKLGVAGSIPVARSILTLRPPDLVTGKMTGNPPGGRFSTPKRLKDGLSGLGKGCPTQKSF